MTGTKTQTLEDLRKSTDAAWLWDGMRGRLVWANAAGIKLFDGQSVFDLIDKAFDPAEGGIQAIAHLTKTLKRDEVVAAELDFPSAGLADALNCRCWLHTLADGRAGLLVVRPTARQNDESVDPLFAQLPVAAVLLAKDGTFLAANAMASEMFDTTLFKNLGQLIAGPDKAEKLLARLASSNIASSIEAFDGLFGQREGRLTIKRMVGPSSAFAIMVVDDITTRRQMERQLTETAEASSNVAPAKMANDDQAFAALARSLNEAIAQPNKAVASPRTEAEVIRKPDPVARIDVVTKPAPMVEINVPPATILDALENSGLALIYMQNNLPVFATTKAVKLLSHANLAQMFAQSELWTTLSNLSISSTGVEILTATNSRKSFTVDVNTMPWANGPARQFTLTEIVPPPKPRAEAIPKNVGPPEPQNTVQREPQIEVKPVAAQPVFAPPPMPVEVEAISHAAEEELKSILDIASDGIITLDQDGNIVSFSAGAESLFGYRSAEVKAKPLADFFKGESRKALQDYLAGLKGPGLAAVFNDGREVLGTVKQGGTVPLFLTIGKLQSAHSNAAFCAVVRDITSWKRTEKELREAKEAAEAASRQKSDFLARISHELRTPLNAIMGFSDVMRLGQFGEIKNEKYRAYVNDIHASGGHLLTLINDLLDLSKIEAGKMELNFTAVNITDCADHAIRLLQETATRGRVLVRKSFPEKLPRVVADLRAMRQVMLNLLSNAIKFTDPGGQVIISASIASTGELALKLKDTGIGMSAAEIQDALEPFKRVETAGRETQGTGLGLPLTKALVEANRAKFGLSSEPGQGTLIEITFPTTRVLAE